jgi:hypothetical protein
LRLMRPVRHTSITPNLVITFCIATVCSARIAPVTEAGSVDVLVDVQWTGKGARAAHLHDTKLGHHILHRHSLQQSCGPHQHQQVVETMSALPGSPESHRVMPPLLTQQHYGLVHAAGTCARS